MEYQFTSTGLVACPKCRGPLTTATIEIFDGGFTHGFLASHCLTCGIQGPNVGADGDWNYRFNVQPEELYYRATSGEKLPNHSDLLLGYFRALREWQASNGATSMPRHP